MTSVNSESNVIQIHTLWERLTAELGPILDAHGVCAATAYEIAVFTGITTVVALLGSNGQYYDVWVCDASGNLKQERWEGKSRTLRRLIGAGAPTEMEKYGLPAEEILGSDLWLLARDSIMFAPLPYRPQSSASLTAEGALCLVDPPSAFALNVTALGQLAAHISTYLERAFLRQETDRQRVEFETVYDLAYSLTSSLTLENIFGQLTDPVRRTLNVETISVGLVDPISGGIHFVDSLMGDMFKALPTVRLERGQGIAGHVAQTGEPLIVNNVYKDEHFHRNVDTKSGFRTNSILCVPLKVEQRVVGVLEAINKRNGDFNQDDLRLLQAITGPLAAAIENARLHEDVLAEKRRQETIFASMSEGSLTVNADGIVTAANESLLTLMGHPEDDVLLGKSAGEVIVIRAREPFTHFVELVLNAASEKPEIAADLLRADGSYVPVHVSGAAIPGEDGKPTEMIFVFTDLRQIREVERMRDDFFHNIIHELRTPLATILMYARLLREGKARGDKAKEDRFLGVIERESDRLQQMVRQMLQLAKLEAREIQRSAEPVDLNVLFDEILPPLAETALQKGLNFSQRIAADLPPVMGNQEMVYTIFKNLVENAVKFTLSGTVHVEANATDDLVCVKVQDEGIGIPKEAQPNLFKRFYRAQTAVERGIAGTGLGLYMVKEALERHGGTIDLDSSEGEGSTFIINMPAVPE